MEVIDLLGGGGSICEEEGSVCMRTVAVGTERSRDIPGIIRE